jgi:hypothetical protein
VLYMINLCLIVLKRRNIGVINVKDVKKIFTRTKMLIKNLIFFVIVFLLFYITGKINTLVKFKYQDVKLLVFSLVSTAIIVMVFYVGKIGDSSTKDSFSFEVSPEKLCQGGPYMYTSNPERQRLCSQFSQQDLAQYNCGKGFVGAPVHWDYTSMSNDKWESDINCNDQTYDSPCVL